MPIVRYRLTRHSLYVLDRWTARAPLASLHPHLRPGTEIEVEIVCSLARVREREGPRRVRGSIPVRLRLRPLRMARHE